MTNRKTSRTAWRLTAGLGLALLVCAGAYFRWLGTAQGAAFYRFGYQAGVRDAAAGVDLGPGMAVDWPTGELYLQQLPVALPGYTRPAPPAELRQATLLAGKEAHAPTAIQEQEVGSFVRGHRIGHWLRRP